MARSSLFSLSICSLIVAARLSWVMVKSYIFMRQVNIQSCWKVKVFICCKEKNQAFAWLNLSLKNYLELLPATSPKQIERSLIEAPYPKSCSSGQRLK